jgi:transcription antitermination factor NusG
LAIKWYAIQTTLPTREKIKACILEHGFKRQLKHIKSILVFDYESQKLWVEPGDSLLKGYALLKFDNKYVETIIGILNKSNIGHFLNIGKDKFPKPIPEDQVKEFKKSVRKKKGSYGIGDKVIISEGMYIGLTGEIKQKKRLMARIQINLPNRTVNKWISILSLKRLHNDD